MNKSQLAMLGAILIAIFFVQLLGYWATEETVHTWYTQLNKPSFTPPNYLFGPVWTLLYLMMAIALWLVWKAPTRKSKTKAYFFFWAQMLFNALWSFAFFTLKSPLLGLIDIFLLVFFLVGNVISFYKIHKVAAALLIPYLLWTLYATALNIAIWKLN